MVNLNHLLLLGANTVCVLIIFGVLGHHLIAWPKHPRASVTTTAEQVAIVHLLASAERRLPSANEVGRGGDTAVDLVGDLLHRQTLALVAVLLLLGILVLQNIARHKVGRVDRRQRLHILARLDLTLQLAGAVELIR